MVTRAPVWARMATTPAWPTESWLVYPVRRFKPIATIPLTRISVVRNTTYGDTTNGHAIATSATRTTGPARLIEVRAPARLAGPNPLVSLAPLIPSGPREAPRGPQAGRGDTTRRHAKGREGGR